jgi:hypothetical protein
MYDRTTGRLLEAELADLLNPDNDNEEEGEQDDAA